MDARQAATNADIVLGLFPAHDSKHMDMVDVDDSEQIRVMHLKLRKTDLRYTWICAVGTSKSSRFMHDYLSARVNEDKPAQQELSVGAVLQAVIEQKLQVAGGRFSSGTYLDIGIPGGLLKAHRYDHCGLQGKV